MYHIVFIQSSVYGIWIGLKEILYSFVTVNSGQLSSEVEIEVCCFFFSHPESKKTRARNPRQYSRIDHRPGTIGPSVPHARDCSGSDGGKGETALVP